MNAALRTGQAVETRRVFASTDGDDLTRLSGAPASPHAVPEALINAMFSYLLGVDLPGQGTNYLKQETEFVSDAAYGEPLSAPSPSSIRRSTIWLTVWLSIGSPVAGE